MNSVKWWLADKADRRDYRLDYRLDSGGV